MRTSAARAPRLTRCRSAGSPSGALPRTTVPTVERTINGLAIPAAVCLAHPVVWGGGQVDQREARYSHLFPWSKSQIANRPDGSKVSFELTQEAMVEPPRWWLLLALFSRSETQGSGWKLIRTDDGAESIRRFEHWDEAVAAMRSAIASIENGVA